MNKYFSALKSCMIGKRMQGEGLIGSGLLSYQRNPSAGSMGSDPTYRQVDTANFKHETSQEDSLRHHFDLPSTYTMPTNHPHAREASVIQAANTSPNRSRWASPSFRQTPAEQLRDA